MMKPFFKTSWLVGIALGLGWLSSQPLRGDALVVSRAMKASTITEIFIETNKVRVELEVAMNDLPAFKNMLPDKLYAGMDPDGPPAAERWKIFTSQDWVITADDHGPLDGRLVTVRPRERVLRDEITGEPLPAGEEKPEMTVFAVLEYDFPPGPQPASMTIRPPMDESGRNVLINVGFVVYHQGLMVNDFRFLATAETIRLDWQDPWYTKFDNRNIRRQFSAPLAAYLYMDPFEVRKEVILRPMDLQYWVDLGLSNAPPVLKVEAQAAVKKKIADFLAVMNPVTIDGQSPEPVLDRIHFIQRTARQTRVLDPPEDLPLVSATVGVIYSYPVTGMPRHVFMEWELFSDRISKVPGVATDVAGGMPSTLTTESPVLEWKNFLKKPPQTGLVALSVPNAPKRWSLPLLSLLCLAIVLIMMGKRLKAGSFRPVPGWSRGWLVILIILSALVWPVARVSVPSPFGGSRAPSTEEARQVMYGLLRNIYRAFDYREESRIYDVLSHSVSGDLLTGIYLETRKALELENQGGARAKVKEIELLETSTRSHETADGFTAQCRWNVMGSVGHWGHIHQRRNQYEGELTVKVVDGTWKLTEMEVLSEERQ